MFEIFKKIMFTHFILDLCNGSIYFVISKMFFKNP